MNITVIGGTGLIGSQLVSRLREAGHEVVASSLSTGVDLLTGAGLDEALKGADTVVNVTNSPTFDEASLDFFRTSVGHLLAAGERAGARHQVILSIVGVDQVPQLDYYRAKALQEDLLRQGPTPYSIVRATQFFEFMDAVMTWTADDRTVRLPATPIQPIASAEVVQALADVATAEPLNGTLDVAGPDVFPLDELGRLTLSARKDPRTVVTDDTAGMFAAVEGDVLIAGPGARVAPTHYEDWFAANR
ncbi:SDR family oxidoreductase [Streptomyces sp. NPDC058471]|uniref:SDR family oxidoreductase n=1 Tax=Streptomyces sp. NPDC058471 TaxID=3346516 RepID=UPI00366247D6